VKDEVESENLTSLTDSNNPSGKIFENQEEKDQAPPDDTISSLDTSENTVTNSTLLLPPQDEASPFNYELNPDVYLYTKPVIFITFTGIQTIKLTINNMRPTDMIEAASTSESMTKSTILSHSQRPLMELNAQFGSIKCLLCPKQIHLLIDMATKLIDYITAANNVKKARAAQRLAYLKSYSAKHKSGGRHVVRGCDKRKYEALVSQSGHLGDFLNDEEELADSEEDEENLKTNLSENESSVMFYSMMSESIAFNNSNNNNINNISSNIDVNNMSNSSESAHIDGKFNNIKI